MPKDNVAEFERLKAAVEDLRVKRLAAEAEQTRLENEMAEIRKEIEAAYGVPLEDFDKAITELEAEYARESEALSAEIENCRKQLQEAESNG